MHVVPPDGLAPNGIPRGMPHLRWRGSRPSFEGPRHSLQGRHATSELLQNRALVRLSFGSVVVFHQPIDSAPFYGTIPEFEEGFDVTAPHPALDACLEAPDGDQLRADFR